MVAPDPQTLAYDLRWQVAIAEMPRDANQMKRIVTSNFDQWFWRGHDFDQTAILQHQRIAAAQRDRNFEVEQKL